MPISTTASDSDSNDGGGGVPERLSVPFAKQVPAATTEELTYEAKADATIEAIRVRVYPGAENTLRITPYKRTTTGDLIPLLVTVGKQYVDGDDDKWEFEVASALEESEEIVIVAENTDGSNAHNFRATVDVDYRGGLESLFDGVIR